MEELFPFTWPERSYDGLLTDPDVYIIKNIMKKWLKEKDLV